MSERKEMANVGRWSVPPMQAPTMTNDQIIAEAQRLYHFDAVLHAQVERTVSTLDSDLYTGTGQHMNGEDRSLATLAAAVALLMARLSPDGT